MVKSIYKDEVLKWSNNVIFVGKLKEEILKKKNHN